MKLPTPAQVQYMMQHANETKVPGMIACSVVCISLATIAVASRFIARVSSKIKLRASDWWILVALFFLAAYVGAFWRSTYYGMGRHIILVTDPKSLVICMLVAMNVITVSIMAIKISLCCLYVQIFPLVWMRNACIGISCIVVAYTVAHNVSDNLQCIPISALWDPTVTNARCYQFSDQMVAMGVVNIVTDFAILILPMKPIWELKVSRTKKWQLSLILSLGAFSCVVSVVRIPYLRKMGRADSTWYDVEAGIVSMIEPTIAIIAACLPACRPLFKKLFDNRFRTFVLTYNNFSWGGWTRTYEKSQDETNDGIKKVSNFELASVKTDDEEKTLVSHHARPVHDV